MPAANQLTLGLSLTVKKSNDVCQEKLVITMTTLLKTMRAKFFDTDSRNKPAEYWPEIAVAKRQHFAHG